MQKNFSVGINEDELTNVSGGVDGGLLLFTILVGGALFAITATLAATLGGIGVHRVRSSKKKMTKTEEDISTLRALATTPKAEQAEQIEESVVDVEQQQPAV